LAGKRVVLYVGYFMARKGLTDLITAFQAVATRNDILALVGSGPEETRLRCLSQHDKRILFPGHLEGAEKTSWYKAADLFVLPTLHDPWGLVVNEAMAFGLPVIVTDAAGCTDLVRENGLVVTAGNPDSLATALGQLLPDAELRQEMGERSQVIISKYTVENASDAFLQAIRRALAHERN
jgi:glycosyltransferase involved in cell wall biosynthesis